MIARGILFIMEDCIFCKIVAGGIPAMKIYEDEYALAFLDIHPLAPGHAMVIPKEHAQTILDLSEQSIGPLFQAVKKVTKMINCGIAPRGFTIGINHGRISGQEVHHLHVHIIPRFDGDGGKSVHSVVHNPPQESLENIQKKIINKK